MKSINHNFKVKKYKQIKTRSVEIKTNYKQVTGLGNKVPDGLPISDVLQNYAQTTTRFISLTLENGVRN